MPAEWTIDDAHPAVETALLAGSSGDDRVARAVRHHICAGGNRVRARLALHAAHALNLSEDDAVAIAAGCELLHNASLIHDDLQDRDPERRGRPAVWAVFGSDVALCAGDQLISAAYAALAYLGASAPIAITAAHDAVRATVSGQAQDLAHCDSRGVTIDDYAAIAAEKSGPLLALPLEAPLRLTGHNTAADRAQSAAHAFALGYQALDDMADVDQDRAQGGALNLVLALEYAGLAPTKARTTAAAFARDRLAEAQAAARTLPATSGALLVDYAQRLITKAGDIANAAMPA